MSTTVHNYTGAEVLHVTVDSRLGGLIRLSQIAESLSFIFAMQPHQARHLAHLLTAEAARVEELHGKAEEAA